MYPWLKCISCDAQTDPPLLFNCTNRRAVVPEVAGITHAILTTVSVFILIRVTTLLITNPNPTACGAQSLCHSMIRKKIKLELHVLL